MQYLFFTVYVLGWLLVLVLDAFFFFKQKTAYEMRISDWSSDVCSSDLSKPAQVPGAHANPTSAGVAQPVKLFQQCGFQLGLGKKSHVYSSLCRCNHWRPLSVRRYFCRRLLGFADGKSVV